MSSTSVLLTTRGARGTRALGARLAQALLDELALRGPGAGLLVGLSGELGAGKTTLVQGMVARVPGGEGLAVTSPTFAIVQRYPTTPPVHHLDLYRLGSLEALESVGYRDLYHGEGLTLVEWIDKVPEAIPSEWLEIHLAGTGSDVREFRLAAHGPGLSELVAAVAKKSRRRG